MAKSKAKQSSSSATARAQQPPNACAASLPNELLAQVFNLALEGLGAWERQMRRWELSQICVRWYAAAEPYQEVVAKDTFMAEAVAESLNEDRRARVRSLSMGIEADGAGRSKRAAALLLACPRIDSLEIVAAGNLYLGVSRGRHAHSQLGIPFTEALQAVSPRELRITSSVEKGTDSPWLSARELLDLCANWTRLQSITIDNVRTQNFTRAIPLPTLPPLPITRLRLPVPIGKGRPELAPLLAAASASLLHLHLSGTLDRANRLPYPVTKPFESTVAVAPRLLTLDAVSEDTSYIIIEDEHWWPTLCALRDVRELRLGTLGYKLDEILPLLKQLKHLAILSITDNSPPSQSATFRHSLLTPFAILDFLAEAPALRTLVLPQQLLPGWTVGERSMVRMEAMRKDVVLAFEAGV